MELVTLTAGALESQFCLFLKTVQHEAHYELLLRGHLEFSNGRANAPNILRLDPTANSLKTEENADRRHIFWSCRTEMCTTRQRFSQFCWFVAAYRAEFGSKARRAV